MPAIIPDFSQPPPPPEPEVKEEQVPEQPIIKTRNEADIFDFKPIKPKKEKQKKQEEPQVQVEPEQPKPKKKKTRGVSQRDPEWMKEHMAKMREKSTQVRKEKAMQKKKAKEEKLKAQGIDPNPPPSQNISHPSPSHEKSPVVTPPPPPQGNHSQQHVPNVGQPPSKVQVQSHHPPPPRQPQSNHHNISGLDKLTQLENMIRRDERQKILQEEKKRRENQARELAKKPPVKIPRGLQKWLQPRPENVNDYPPGFW